MNYYPNPYFSSVYQPPLLENAYFNTPPSLPSSDNLKYLNILESENKLLREKVQNLEQKLKSYEEIERETEVLRSKKKIGKKQKMTYECLYPNCQRGYKSTLALNLHIKMKHNGGSIREREAYAKLILECQRDNKQKPEININFPPNFLENYRKKMLQAQSMMKDTST